MGLFSKLFGKGEAKNEILDSSTASNEEAKGDDGSTSIKIFPRIKVNYAHEIYSNDKQKHFAGNKLPDDLKMPDDQIPIAHPLYEDLLLFFAEDKGNRYELLQKKILNENPHLTEDILKEASVQAMINEVGPNIKMHGDRDDIVMITAGGNFEAALILLDDFWNQLHDVFADDLVLAIPARDMLVVCKQSNKEGQEKQKQMVRGFFDDPKTEGLLSKGLYLKKKGDSNLKLIDTAF